MTDGEVCENCGDPTGDVGWPTDTGIRCEDCGPEDESA